LARVIVLGGGVVGLSCALRLAEDGHTVSVLEAGSFSAGCSHGNSGLVVPSHVVPLASPGVIVRGLKWLASPSSPFRIKPSADPSLLRWLRLFQASCSRANVERAAPLLASLANESRDTYGRWAAEGWDFGFRKAGLLQHCRTEAGLHEEAEAAETARVHGIRAEVLEGARLAREEPLSQGVGGVLYPDDAQLDPAGLMRALTERCGEAGVALQMGTAPASLGSDGVAWDGRRLESDWTVVSAGAASGRIAAQIGLRLPMVGGKGYSFLVDSSQLPVVRPTILVEDRVALSPLGERTRLGGTLEIGSAPGEIDMRRVGGIAQGPSRHFGKSLDAPASSEVWSGQRPCSPDGLPYVGAAPGHPHVLFATGHAMLGVTLAPATARIVTELVAGGDAPAPLAADRFA
jgi:D-amino-acid dehydrogenase